MPLENLGGGKWRWGKHGKIYSGPGAKKKAIKQALSFTPEAEFKKEISDARNHYDQEVLTFAKAALQSYEEAKAKVVQTDGGQWKILGLGGKVFATLDEAIQFQYNASEAVEDGPGVNTKRKGDKKNENFFASIKDAFATNERS